MKKELKDNRVFENFQIVLPAPVNRLFVYSVKGNTKDDETELTFTINDSTGRTIFFVCMGFTSGRNKVGSSTATFIIPKEHQVLMSGTMNGRIICERLTDL